MSLHKPSNSTPTKLAGCEGCRKTCQWRGLVAIEAGVSAEVRMQWDIF